MNTKILLLAVTVAVLSSCTTAYKTGQTPDDVYYSPTRPQGDEYVQRDKKDDDRRYRHTEYDYYEDQYLRMKVRNRYRWSDLDDPYNNRYNYSVYNYSYGGFNNPWTPATYWNNNYNPYYHGTAIISSQTPPRYSGPRTFNLNSYNNTALTNGNYSNPKATGPGSNSYNNNNYNNTYNAPRNSSSNNGSNSGNILRNVFSNNNNNSSGNSSNNTSSSTSSPSSSSSSSGSSGSSAPVRRF